MLEHDELTHLHMQRVIKPKVEDVLPYFLDEEMIGIALGFVAHLRAIKMNPRWAGVHNAWRANNKNRNKVIRFRAGSKKNAKVDKKIYIIGG